MKNTFNIIILTLVLFLTACNDDAFLKIEQPQEFGWQNISELEYAAVSPYSKMFYGGWDASHSEIVTIQVMMSDYFKFLGNAEDFSTDQFYNRKFSQLIPELGSFYTKMYTVIGLSNNGLNFVVKNNGNPFFSTDSTEIAEVKRIKGELLFMRAYAYYQLATTFCPAYIAGGANDSKILVKRDSATYYSVTALNNLPVATSEIYDLMVSDLKQAKACLPADWATGMNVAYKNRARANKWAASAMLAQVYFTMGKFNGNESALTEYNDIITNGGYSLSADPFTNFNNQSAALLKSENSEVILWAYFADQRLLDRKQDKMHEALRYTHFNKSGRIALNGGNGITSGTTQNWSNFHDWLQLKLSIGSLIEMGWINSIDSTETATAKYDKRYYNAGTSSSFVNQYGLFYKYKGAYVNKKEFVADGNLASDTLSKRTKASKNGDYIIDAKFGLLIGKEEPVVLVNKYYRTLDGKKQNIPVIRLAEIYLNRAMCKLKTGDQAGADADFNEVAKRAWNTTLGGAYNLKSGVTERDILIERWKELAGEDAWYKAFCQACGFTIGAGSRTDNSNVLTPPYSTAYWSNSIPLSELDFQKK